MIQLKELTGHTYECITERDNPDPPAILVLHRKAIRMIGDTKVAVYYSDVLKQNITLPFKAGITEETKKTIADKPKTKPKPVADKPDKTKLKSSLKPKKDDDNDGDNDIPDNLSVLKNIVVKNKADAITFTDGTELDIEVPQANAIVSMYARCTKENKEKIELMLSKGVNTVMKLIKLAMSQ